MERHPQLDWSITDDIILGCANQAGEDNRNVARMAGLLAGLPLSISGTTINRLCGSGLDAIAFAARSIKAGEAGLMIAGGVESMSRAPFVMGKSESAFSRQAQIFDTTIGWRFINPLMDQQFSTHSMPETAENVAEKYQISRTDQDVFALRSQQRTEQARQKVCLRKKSYRSRLSTAKAILPSPPMNTLVQKRQLSNYKNLKHLFVKMVP